jgi:hypothetical protein
MQDGKGSKDAPPFATADGKQTAKGDQGHSPGVDFQKTTNSQSAPMPGRDFTKENRPQSEARPEVVPAEGEIPKGGKDLKADVVKANVGGDTEGVAGRAPFKGLR